MGGGRRSSAQGKIEQVNPTVRRRTHYAQGGRPQTENAGWGVGGRRSSPRVEVPGKLLCEGKGEVRSLTNGYIVSYPRRWKLR